MTSTTSQARERTRTAYRRSVLLLVLLLLVLMIGSCAGAIITESTYRRDHATVLRRIEREAETIASMLDLLVQDRITLLETVANTLRYGADGNAALLETVLDNIDPPRLGFTGGIAWIDLEGMVRVDSGARATPYRLADSATFDAAIARNGAFVGSATLAAQSDFPQVVIAVPTHLAGEPNRPSGVVTGSIGLSDIATVAPAVQGRFGAVQIIDRAGNLLVADGGPVTSIEDAGMSNELLAAAAVAKGSEENATGTRSARARVIGYAPVGATGWTVFVEADHDAALATLTRRRIIVLVALAALTLTSIALIVRTALRLRREARIADRVTRDTELLAAAGAATELRDPSPEAILEGACRALGGRVAAYATAYVVRDDAVVLSALATIDPEQERELSRFIGHSTPLDSELVFAAAARTSSVQRVERLDPEAVRAVLHSSDDETRDLALRYTSGATVAIPFTTAERPDGAPTHVIAAALPVDATDDFTPGDVAIITELAHRCAAALRTVELRLAAEVSRDQAEALQQLSAALSAALTVDDVAAAVTDHGARAAGAAIVNIAIPGRAGMLRVHHDPAIDAEIAERWAEIPCDHATALSDAFRIGQPVWSPTADDLSTRYPARDDVHSEDRSAVGIAAVAALPLRDPMGTTIGALGFGWTSDQTFDAPQRARVAAVLAAVAPALDRAHLTEQLQYRRARAEARARFAAALASAAGIDEVVHLIAMHGMTVLGASGVVVALFDDDHRDLEVRATAGSGGEEVARLGRLTTAVGGPLVEAVTTRAPVLLTSADDARRRFPDRPDLHREAELRSLVAFPLLAGHEISGAVRVHFPAPRDANSLDIDEAAVFAAQAAQAVERARLFERERRRVRRMEQMQAAAASLARAATVEAVAVAVSDHALTALGARWAAVMLRADDGPDELAVIASAGVNGLALASRVPVDSSTPFGLAILTSRPVYPARRSTDTAAPAGSSDDRTVSAWVALPIGATPYGAIALQFDQVEAIAIDRRPDIDAFHLLCEHAFTRARRFDVEHEVASVLQASLLPGVLDHVPAVPASARYRAGRRGTIVGGDWYDVIDLGEGRVGLVVGDVVGRGPRAAAAMGQLRIAVRTLAPFCSPAVLLSRLDAIVERVPDAQFATVAYVMVDTAGRTITWSLAGHPPPLFVRDGQTEYLAGGAGAPLGAFVSMTRFETTGSLDGISRLVLYTDGLVERRNVPIDDQFALLAREVPTDLDCADVCERIIKAMLSDDAPSDDVAVLCAEIPHMPVLDITVPGRLDQLARVRSELRGWLRRLDVTDEEANDVLIAVGEACANAIEHGYRQRGGDVRVRARRLVNSISVQVLDTGDWRPPERDESRGRGLPILHGAMDDVVVDSDERGTTILLTKQVVAPARLVEANSPRE